MIKLWKDKHNNKEHRLIIVNLTKVTFWLNIIMPNYVYYFIAYIPYKN